ncbi:MAG: tRNA dihydrouridine synthase DusB [Robiginitomaculum sp.]|nr:MAG: tRNA dihydrouridine synthase DusB [Robiginitomaculum sp.]
MTLYIQNIQLENPVVLAPMSGVTDLPFRKLVKKLGAGLVISEMTASEQLVGGRRDMLRKIARDASPGPFVVQLAGREAIWMAEGAKMAVDAGAQIIDINMGCPSRHVTKGASGSALMRDLDHAMGLIEAVIDAVDVPVTLKMRLGWDHASLNAPELAQRAEQAGIAMVSVHGRTRCQFYKGDADWAAVRPVRDVLKIPLLVNGDIASAEDAKRAMDLSGADGVMVGRASYGRPWLPGYIANQMAGRSSSIPDPAQQVGFLLEQFQGSLQLYGPTIGIKMFRKHIAWTLDAVCSHSQDQLEISKTRQQLCRSADAVEIHSKLTALQNDLAQTSVKQVA